MDSSGPVASPMIAARTRPSHKVTISRGTPTANTGTSVTAVINTVPTVRYTDASSRSAIRWAAAPQPWVQAPRIVVTLRG